jgi:archaellum component FlaF (FlaF/FlaG flagellin family)
MKKKFAAFGIALVLALSLASVGSPVNAANDESVSWNLNNQNVIVKVVNESDETRSYRAVVFLTDQGGQFERQKAVRISVEPGESQRLVFPYKDSDTKFRIKVTRDGEVLLRVSELLDSVFIPANNKSDSVFEPNEK